MSREVVLIYQDCPDCGASKKWYERQLEIAKKNGIIIQKVSFVAPGAKGLIIKAASHGIGKMPFFTDDMTRPRRFSYNLEDLVQKPKKAKKTVRSIKKEGNSDGSDAEG